MPAELVALVVHQSTALVRSVGCLFDQVAWCTIPHEAAQLIQSRRPHTILIDTWRAPDAAAPICTAAARWPARPHVLLATDEIARVASAVKLGCDSVLLKPFPLNLLISRLSRLRYTNPATEGTNVRHPALPCPRCGTPGAIAVDAAGYRRCWFVCLECEHAWLGRDPSWALEPRPVPKGRAVRSIRAGSAADGQQQAMNNVR